MLPAIMLAAYRGHYAECIVFTAHLIASCLYHACAEEVYSVCLASLGLLRWSDVLTTVLSVWVTLITMARLPVTVRSVLNMMAVLCIAVLVTHAPHSVTMTLVIPSLAAAAILVTSWSIACVSTGDCQPRSRYKVQSTILTVHPLVRYLVLHCFPGLFLLTISILTCLFHHNKHGDLITMIVLNEATLS